MKKYLFWGGFFIIVFLTTLSPTVKVPVYNFEKDTFKYKLEIVSPFLTKKQNILTAFNKLKFLTPETGEIDENITFGNAVISKDTLIIDLTLTSNDTSSFHENLIVRQLKETLKINFKDIIYLKVRIFPKNSFKHLDTTKPFKINNKGEI